MDQAPFQERQFGPTPREARGHAIVIHGFTGAPSDVWPVAQVLGTRGLSVTVPCLRGHQAGTAGVGSATLEQWREDVLQAARTAAEHKPGPVYCVGFSMGALLVLDLATRSDIPIAAVAALAPPLALGPLGRHVSALVSRAPWLKDAALRKRGGPDISNGTPLPGAPALPLRGIHQLYRLMDDVRAALPSLKTPLLVLHGRLDHTAPVAGAYALARTATAASPMRIVILERSFHVITRDVEATRVAREVGDFFERQLTRTHAQRPETSDRRR